MSASDPVPFAFRPLEFDDELVVRGWLEDYLCNHIERWTRAYGLNWTPTAVAEHLQRHDLVGRDWAELRDANGLAGSHVEVALETNAMHRPLGIVFAAVRPDQYIKLPVGVVSWLYVTPSARRRSIATALLRRTMAWGRSLGTAATEVFVTRDNLSAVHCYEHAGFASLDLRMIAGPS